ncbi:hypothetical protein Btru_044835 [Bulinus truncatus]|nr:hypothetical protein Btru_044835 [Bulinus truncatus]
MNILYKGKYVYLATGFIACVVIFIGLRNRTSYLVHDDSVISTNTEKNPVDDEIRISNVKSSVDELTHLLSKRLNDASDMRKVVLNTSCDDINTLHGCFDNSCPQKISLDPGTRVADLFKSGKLTLSPAQRDLILSISKNISENDVIIASASSSNHYHEMQAMFKSLHRVVYPRLTNFSVVLFDIGLSPEERRMTEKNCKCQVLSFPADIFPPHVKNNQCYSWKPLIVLATISRARQYLVWQDSSVRWADNFRTIFDRTNIYGHQILRYIDSSRVPANTIKQTFDYLGDQPCAYLPYPEIQGNCMLHKHDPFVVKAILEPWARCALEKECICPAEPGSVLGCRSDLKIHRCHRFDQSVLTIILAKVYGEEMYRFISPETSFDKPQYISVKRGDSVSDYFKS